MKMKKMNMRIKSKSRKTAQTAVLAVILAAGVILTAGCGAAAAEKEIPAANGAAQSDAAGTEAEVDAISSASQIFYQDSSLDQQQLWTAIAERKGGCTIATVNEDGTPNLIVAVPATAGDSHIYFTWADNASKANVQRTGQAMVSYYIYSGDAESKSERNIGARMKLELERDEAVLEKLAESDPTIKAGTVFRVAEILPLG